MKMIAAFFQNENKDSAWGPAKQRAKVVALSFLDAKNYVPGTYALLQVVSTTEERGYIQVPYTDSIPGLSFFK